MNEEELLNAMREEIREYLKLDGERLECYGLVRAILVKQLQELNAEVCLSA